MQYKKKTIGRVTVARQRILLHRGTVRVIFCMTSALLGYRIYGEHGDKLTRQSIQSHLRNHTDLYMSTEWVCKLKTGHSSTKPFDDEN